MRGAIVLASVLWANAAAAELSVTLVPTATVTPAAPATLTLTASIAGDDPPLEIAWGGLDAWPGCGGAACAVELALAGCRRVAVTVTGLSGAVVEDAIQACATVDGVAPPQARVALAAATDGLRVDAAWTAGGAPVVASALWVDDALVPVEGARLTDEGAACHAIDLVVVDALGQVGRDHRQVCLRDDGPQVDLQYDPGGFVASSGGLTACVTPRHALGLEVEVVDGPGAGCGASAPPPRTFTRRAVRVIDSQGLEAVDSAFVGARPAEGPPTYAWATTAPGPVVGGAPRAVSAVGGVAPVTFEADAIHPTFGRRFVPVVETASRAATLSVPAMDYDEGWRLQVRLRDARGLETASYFALTGEGGGLDGGVVLTDGGDGPGVPVADAGAACTAGLGLDGDLAWLAALALLAGRRRRAR